MYIILAGLVASIKQANENRIRENKRIYLMSGTKSYYNEFTGSTFEDGSLPRIHINIFGLGKLKESHKIVLQQ